MIPNKAVYQILDANRNRAREGLRVAEEIFRFVHKQPAIVRRIKLIRHEIDAVLEGSKIDDDRLTASRDSKRDPGRTIHTARELSRGSLKDILAANLRRVGEATRVLEEFSKLFDVRASKKFKEIRFRFYDVEKAATRRSC